MLLLVVVEVQVVQVRRTGQEGLAGGKARANMPNLPRIQELPPPTSKQVHPVLKRQERVSLDCCWRVEHLHEPVAKSVR